MCHVRMQDRYLFVLNQLCEMQNSRLSNILSLLCSPLDLLQHVCII